MWIKTQDTSTTEITYKNDFVGLIFTFMLKSEFPKSVHALHSGLFLSFAFYTNTEGGDTQKAKCEKRERVKWIGVIHFILAQKVQTEMKTCRHRNTCTERRTDTMSIQHYLCTQNMKKYLKD